MNELSIHELALIAQQAEVFSLMASRQSPQITIDYVPPRCGMILPRAQSEADGPLIPLQHDPITITFTLSEAMFGGVLFVALTCGGRVVVNPFPWSSYEHLAQVSIHL